MQERLNSSISEEEKWKVIKLLVKQALLDRKGNLTVEFRVPTPSSFATSTLLRAKPPDYTKDSGSAGDIANH